jgi:hypothetical protein
MTDDVVDHNTIREKFKAVRFAAGNTRLRAYAEEAVRDPTQRSASRPPRSARNGPIISRFPTVHEVARSAVLQSSR